MKNHAPAFTLIELLVAVAVIAILAAIAVPNFLEAQTRSKVSRAKADMATLRTALESYAVDSSSYPVNSSGLGLTGDLYNLTKPVAYISSIPVDPFLHGVFYFYFSPGKVPGFPDPKFGQYVVACAGPDHFFETTINDSMIYDPTNGTTSRGDIVVSQR
ncbi:MAG: type II secretion system protein GspG [Candidatus Sumerlaeota bacterium]